MLMKRDDCWHLLYDSYYYYNCSQWYYSRLSRIRTIISVVTAISTASCIAAWTMWQKIPLAWAIVVGMAQFIQVVYPQTPWSKSVVRMEIAVHEFHELCTDVQIFWNEKGLDAPESINNRDICNEHDAFIRRLRKIELDFLPIEKTSLSPKVLEQIQNDTLNCVSPHTK